MTSNKTSMGLEEHIAIFIAYLLGWLSGLVILLIEKDNQTVRYHAAQSIVVFGTFTLITMLFPLFLFFAIIFSLLNLAIFVLWIVFLVTALKKTPLKLDFLAPYAERLAAMIKT